MRKQRLILESYDPPRRSSHGIVCPQCGSSQVFVLNTQTRQVATESDDERLLIRKQGCRCGDCDHAWWRRVRIRETLLPED